MVSKGGSYWLKNRTVCDTPLKRCRPQRGENRLANICYNSRAQISQLTNPTEVTTVEVTDQPKVNTDEPADQYELRTGETAD